MSKVLYADIEATTLVILKAYIDKFSSGTTLEELRTTGIASKLRMNVKKPDTLLVVLGQSVISLNKEKLSEVLKNDKVHQYTDDATLSNWLSKSFGGTIDIDIKASEPKEEVVKEPEQEKEDEKFFGGNEPQVDNSKLEELEREKKKLLGEINVLEETNENLRARLQETLEDTDAGDIREYKAKVADLEDKLLKKEGELRELHFEVDTYKNRAREMGTASVEVEALRNKIDDAESKISTLSLEKSKLENKLDDITSSYEESQAQNDSLLSSIDTYKGELNKAKEFEQKYNELVANYENITADCESLREEVSELSEKLSNAEKELTDKEEIKSDLAGARSLITVKQECIESLEEELDRANEYKAKYTGVSNQLDSITLENNCLKEDIDELNNQSNELQSKVDTLLGEKEKLESALDNKAKSLDDNIKELDLLKSKVGTLTIEKESVESRVVELQSEKERIESELNLKKSEVSDTSSEIEELRGTVSELRSDLSKITSEKDLLGNKLNSLNTEIKSKEECIKDLTEEMDELKGNISEKQSELTTVKSENESLKKKLSDLTDELNKKGNDYSDVNAKVISLKEEIESLKSYSESLESKLKTNEAESNIIKSDMENAKNDSEKAELELQSIKPEINKLRGTVSDLQTDIKAKDKIIEGLRKQLSVAPVTGVNSTDSEEAIRLKQEILKAKDLIRERNDIIEELNDLVDEYQSDIFMEVANSAMPKTAITTQLKVPDTGLKNVKLCVAGSGESNFTAYKVLKEETSLNKNKKYLIVDLVNESFIDSTFGAKKIPNPLDWLEGREGIKKFVSSSSQNNVKIVSFGLNYMNDSYYLRVNWEERLKELNNLGITVIIYIGVIDCIVRNILFNSISKCCRTYVITKASPANLRACLLHLNSFPQVLHTTVLCSEYTEYSKKMYDILGKKYKTAIVEQGKPIGM